MSENEEIMNETENETMAAEVEAVETVETEAAEVEAADEVSAEEEAEVVEAAVDYDDEELMDKMQKAARLLRSRRFAISKEEEAKAERMANIERAITEKTRAVYVETMGNPCSDLTDIDAAAEIAHRHGIMLVVDNTFATPYLLRPIEHGADLVVYSATKFLGGHGTSLAGIIVDGGRFDYAASGRYPWLTEPDPSYHGLSYTGIAGKAALITYIRAQLLRDEGPCLSPFNCFLILQGLETLSLRVERHVENALKVIDYLKTCPLVEKIHHPSLPDSPDHALYERYFPKGAGSIFLVDLKGGAETAVKFVDSLKLFSLLANVADTKSLVIHPASTTHSQMPAGEQLKAGIRPGSVRFSIGIENAEDIIADLDQAFRACGD